MTENKCPCDSCPVDYEEEGCCCERYIQWHDVRGDLMKFERPQGEITEEDIQNAIKAGYENGYSMAKAKYQRPQGEWINDEEHSITINMFRCSNCNGGGYPHFKYCPHCGAEMKGDKE